MKNVKVTSITVTPEEAEQVKAIMDSAGWSFSETVRKCVFICYRELKRLNKIKERADAKYGKME